MQPLVLENRLFSSHAESGRLLIVDDELPNRMILRKMMRGYGYDVREASDGATALRLAREQRPDLILVDVNMPGMGGFEFCERIRQEPLTREIPVIMVTGETSVEAIEKAFMAGATDYVRKPFNPRELMARARNALQLKRSTDELRQWQRLMKHELAVAGSLQKAILAARPLFEADMVARFVYQPCLEVGGDVFDCISFPDGSRCLYIGDVCGHGVAQALLSSLLKATMTELVQYGKARGPSAICNELDLRFRRLIQDPSLYATLLLAFYDPATWTWSGMNCGHPPPLVLAPSEGPAGKAEAGPGGVPIGFAIAEPASYRPEDEFQWVTPPGSFLFFYSDGLTESRHETTREELGEDRLHQLVGRVQRGQGFMSLAAEVCAAVSSAGFNLSGDDCTAVSVEILRPERVLFKRHLPLERAEADALSKEAEQVLLGWGWADARAAEIQLVVLEYVANIIDHGGCPAGSAMSFWMGAGERTVRMTFRDGGKEWHYGRALKKAGKYRLDSSHGRGLRIITRLANRVDVTRTGNENVADLLFERVRPADSESQTNEAEGAYPS